MQLFVSETPPFVSETSPFVSKHRLSSLKHRLSSLKHRLSLRCIVRAGTSLCTCLYTRNSHRRQVHFQPLVENEQRAETSLRHSPMWYRRPSTKSTTECRPAHRSTSAEGPCGAREKAVSQPGGAGEQTQGKGNALAAKGSGTNTRERQRLSREGQWNMQGKGGVLAAKGSGTQTRQWRTIGRPSLNAEHQRIVHHIDRLQKAMAADSLHAGTARKGGEMSTCRPKAPARLRPGWSQCSTIETDCTGHCSLLNTGHWSLLVTGHWWLLVTGYWSLATAGYHPTQKASVSE